MSRPLSPEPPARRERNAAETRRRILEAAEAEFAAKGFAGARLREVAQVAGIQQALIHHYFEDKDGLYRAVLDRAIEQVTADSWAILGQSTSVAGLLEGFIELLLRFYQSHANLLAMLRMEAASGSHLVLDVLQQKSRPVFEAAEVLLRDLQERGQIRSDLAPSDIIVSVLSQALFPFLEGPLLHALWPAFSVAPEPLEARKRAMVALLLRGISP
ncbi:MAG: TetR/AcrR family transcriptional regulator [Polyangiaceae bacterium]|jgi:TetR/AcrR family transcriptional regulator|nr:TetR/AcrR family transcriptional regulator [Polyangiaceae bacterium]